MRSFAVPILCHFIFLPTFGQDINFVQNTIYNGDSLVQRKMNLKEFDVQGKDHTWSLKGIEADKKEYRSRFLEKRNGLESWTWTYQYKSWIWNKKWVFQ